MAHPYVLRLEKFVKRFTSSDSFISSIPYHYNRTVIYRLCSLPAAVNALLKLQPEVPKDLAQIYVGILFLENINPLSGDRDIKVYIPIVDKSLLLGIIRQMGNQNVYMYIDMPLTDPNILDKLDELKLPLTILTYVYTMLCNHQKIAPLFKHQEAFNIFSHSKSKGSMKEGEPESEIPITVVSVREPEPDELSAEELSTQSAGPHIAVEPVVTESYKVEEKSEVEEGTEEPEIKEELKIKTELKKPEVKEEPKVNEQPKLYQPVKTVIYNPTPEQKSARIKQHLAEYFRVPDITKYDREALKALASTAKQEQVLQVGCEWKDGYARCYVVLCSAGRCKPLPEDSHLF